MRSLVIDDDPVAGKLLRHLLARHGEAEWAADGMTGIRQFRMALKAGTPFDLISLDIFMTDLDGHEALVNIRSWEKGAGIPAGKGARIVMASAHGDAKNVMMAFRNECDGFLVKPITTKALDDFLAEVGLLPVS